jgi:predicted RNase H-like HicB family nuclease
MRTKILTAVVHREREWYVANCPEIGTASQGRTFDEAVVNLKEATELYLEETSEELYGPSIITTFEAAVNV